MKSIDIFLDRMPSKDYNCLDFVKEAWAYLVGDDATDALEALSRAAHTGDVPVTPIRSFRRLETPSTPCIAVIQKVQPMPHIGIIIDGRILHIHNGGVEFQYLSVMQRCFNMRVKFYR